MNDPSQLIRNIPDWPKPGIQFKDITPLLADAAGLKWAITSLCEPWRKSQVDLVLGIDARGFLFSSAVALELGAGCIVARKPGKLPAATIRESFSLEYGEDSLELHADAVRPGQRVLLVDDLLATGGTMSAAKRLVERLGGTVLGCSFLIELTFLSGRSRLETSVHSLIQYATEAP